MASGEARPLWLTIARHSGDSPLIREPLVILTGCRHNSIGKSQLQAVNCFLCLRLSNGSNPSPLAAGVLCHRVRDTSFDLIPKLTVLPMCEY